MVGAGHPRFCSAGFDGGHHFFRVLPRPHIASALDLRGCGFSCGMETSGRDFVSAGIPDPDDSFLDRVGPHYPPPSDAGIEDRHLPVEHGWSSSHTRRQHHYSAERAPRGGGGLQRSSLAVFADYPHRHLRVSGRIENQSARVIGLDRGSDFGSCERLANRGHRCGRGILGSPECAGQPAPAFRMGHLRQFTGDYFFSASPLAGAFSGRTTTGEQEKYA